MKLGTPRRGRRRDWRGRSGARRGLDWKQDWAETNCGDILEVGHGGRSSKSEYFLLFLMMLLLEG